MTYRTARKQYEEFPIGVVPLGSCSALLVFLFFFIGSKLLLLNGVTLGISGVSSATVYSVAYDLTFIVAPLVGLVRRKNIFIIMASI